MSWIETETTLSFEELPIMGLFFISGNQAAFGQKYAFLKGKKYPKITFPSGAHCDVEESQLWAEGIEENLVIAIFDELVLALRSNRNEAFETIDDIALWCGFEAKKVDDDQLEVWGSHDDEHVLITYDNEERQVIDVKRLK